MAFAANYILSLAISYSQHVLIHILYSGTYFGKISEFNEVHRKRRSKAVADYLLGIPDSILRAAVTADFTVLCLAAFLLKLFVQIQKAIEQDLQDLNIDITI